MEKFDAWIVLKKIAGESAEWSAHCLELDVVSQGTGAEHAYRMGVEAAALTLKWDMEEGRDPLSRPSAPDEDWEDLLKLQKDKAQIEVKDALGGDFSVIAVRVTFDLERISKSDDPQSSHSPGSLGSALARRAA